jgi:hypothetical protein
MIIEHPIYLHIKTGKRYLRLFEATDCTNSRDQQPVTVYCRYEAFDPKFVRATEEVNAKFRAVEL